MIQRWVTINGNPVPIRSNQTAKIKRSDLDLSTKLSVKTKPVKNRFLIKRHFRKPQKQFYEKGWTKELYRSKSGFSIDIKNFGEGNYSFVVRKNNKEIFTVPKSLLKNAVKSGFTLVGLPSLPVDGIPIDGIVETIKLYQRFTN